MKLIIPLGQVMRSEMTSGKHKQGKNLEVTSLISFIYKVSTLLST